MIIFYHKNTWTIINLVSYKNCYGFIIRSSENLPTYCKLRYPKHHWLVNMKSMMILQKQDIPSAYHLSEWTGWDDPSIVVRIFPKSANQPNKMALTFRNSISCCCIRLMRDWKLENFEMVRKFLSFCSKRKRRRSLKELNNFRTEFPKNYLIIWLQTEISGVFGQMVSTPVPFLRSLL